MTIASIIAARHAPATAHALYEEEQSIRLSDEERAELVRDNTRNLHMAATRADQRPVMTHVGDVPGGRPVDAHSRVKA